VLTTPINIASYSWTGRFSIDNLPVGVSTNPLTPSTSWGGDLTGTGTNPTVVAVQGDSWSTNPPTHGQVPTWDTNSNSYIPSNAGSGDITDVQVAGGILAGGTNSGGATITLTTNALNAAITNTYVEAESDPVWGAVSNSYLDKATYDADENDLPDNAEGTAIYVRKASAGTINKGQPVYVESYNPSGFIEVELADADDASKMPAIGIAAESIGTGTDGKVEVSGRLDTWDTSTWSVKDALYVSTTAGVLTNAAPTATNALVQKMAIVLRSHGSQGAVEIVGAGRANDIPNDINFTDIQGVATSGQITEADPTLTDNSTVAVGDGSSASITVTFDASAADGLLKFDTGPSAWDFGAVPLQNIGDPIMGGMVGDRDYNDARYVQSESDPTLTDDGAVTIGDGTSSSIALTFDASAADGVLTFDTSPSAWLLGGAYLQNPADPIAGAHVGDRDYNDGRYLNVSTAEDGNSLTNLAAANIPYYNGVQTITSAASISLLPTKTMMELTLTNAPTISMNASALRQPHMLTIFGTNTVTMHSQFRLVGTWTQTGTNHLSIFPTGAATNWFYGVTTE